MRPRKSAEKISMEDQKLFQSGIVMLLYHMKHSRPDIANSLRQLSKVMDGANKAAFVEMYQVIKYVLDTKNLGMKVKPTRDKD